VSLEVLHEHRQLWARKPALAAVYAVWFDALLEELPTAARVLEVGAGPGFLGEHARRDRPDLRWLASDLVATPWNDVAADALALPLRDASLDRIVGLDVLHHLAAPGDFLRESARVLRPGGQLALVEPWVTPLSFPVYRWLHQEGCSLGLDPWHPFAAGSGKQPFDGDAAVPWRLVRVASTTQWRALGFEPPALRRLNGFAYLLSLGFRGASLLPLALVPALRGLDRASQPLAALTGMRALLRWERRVGGPR
jgi:SAM-dependent methyltransferase